jgi:hypothetical protein
MRWSVVNSVYAKAAVMVFSGTGTIILLPQKWKTTPLRPCKILDNLTVPRE